MNTNDQFLQFREYALTHEYEFFQINRPQDYKYGLEPEAQSVGKVILNETRTVNGTFKAETVKTYQNKDEVAIGYTLNSTLQVTQGEDILSTEIYTPNPDVFALLAATR